MSRLENHHIAGKENSELTATICVNQHIHITNRQRGWDSRWTMQSNSENLRASFIIQGIQEILIELHSETGIRDYRVMADSLYPSIRAYRERDQYG